MTAPLAVAVVWHMHQPWYRDDVQGGFVLPWVRRRAAKDYLHMVQVLERHPAMRVTVNLVPSLLAQLEMYGAPGVSDADRDLCLRPASDLTAAERDFLVAGAAHDDYGRRVSLLTPYIELVRSLVAAPDARSVADLRDLQVWTLLAWIDPDQIRSNPALASLANRGRGFTEDDKLTVDAAQLDLLRTVIPAYREAIAAGQVEPMTSPYHHPILPLLIDADSARVATPDIAIAQPPLQAVDDAREQLRRGLSEFARATGHGAVGVWPPECAVSPAAAQLMRSEGAGFALSDEHVLARTLVREDVRGSGELHRAYRDQSGLPMVFRDATLSNLIGFTYQSSSAEEAVADLLGRLETIAAGGPDDGRPRLVTIALDGENFKDFYAENATPFLEALYTGLTSHPLVRSTHIGAFLEQSSEAIESLPALFTGSWVDADLRTWVGQPAHTRAWSLLGDTRRALLTVDARTACPGAWDELLIAEASDWFWWFGEHHDSGRDAAWDDLFRAHLRNAHVLAGLAVPQAVDEPLISGGQLGLDCAPLRSIDPVEAGPGEWGCAGVAEVGSVFGAMRPPASSVERILYGGGNGRLHLRFGDTLPRFERAIVDAGPAGSLVIERAARSLSVALPQQGPLDFAIVLEEPGRGTERVPERGTVRVAAPGDDIPGRLRVLIATAECAPLAVAGQLAGLVAATAADAGALGHEVVVVVPHHRGASFGASPGVRVAELTIPGVGASCRVVQGALGDRAVPVLSVDAAALFDRPGIYGEPDDGTRYIAFCAAVIELLAATGFAPDVVHGFEWQTAPLVARLAADPGRPATVLSVGEGSPGYVVAADTLADLGIGGVGEGPVDLLDLGRSVATVTEATPRRVRLDGLYAAALSGLEEPSATPVAAVSPRTVGL